MAEEAVLGYLEKNDEISDSGEFASARGIDHNEIVNIIKSLHGFRLVDAQVPLKLLSVLFVYVHSLSPSFMQNFVIVCMGMLVNKFHM